MKCVQCGFDFELSERIFEQRLIADTDFCGRCFKQIMSTESQEDVDKIVLPQMVVK